METSIFSLALLLISSHITISSSKHLFNSTTDQHALLAFKTSITSDPHSLLTNNWSNKTSPCNWIGVSCGSKHRRVIALNLSGFDLRGTIAPHLGNLTFLRSLDISSNGFTGPVPSELSKLRRLEELDAAVNNLSHEIPSWLGALTRLTRVRLNNNSFSGGIPPSLLNISRLRILNVGDNYLEGKIPDEIGNLSCLETLILAGNKFTSSVPRGIFNISSLIVIGLGRNSLSGKLPNDFSPKLRKIGLSFNLIHGRIPVGICKCGDLETLSLSINHFNGGIPSELGSLSMLRLLYIGVNDFQGGIPAEIGNLSRLEELSIPDSSLTGNIPKSIFNISSLNYIDLSNNTLSGIIPSNTLHNLPQLEMLYLQKNKLTGYIPEQIGHLSSLTHLQLNKNNFIGYIPKQFGNLTFLTYLHVNDNNLEGELPEELANLAYLENFSVLNNSLSGSIPSFIFNLSAMKVLGLSQNQFDSLPSKIEMLSQGNLEGLYLHHNLLSGEIPSYLTNASKLTTLSLESNSFTGSIPDFGNLRLLNWFSISENSLSGAESSSHELRFLSSLVDCQYLELIDISSNPLHGILPTSVANLSTSLLTLGAEDGYISGPIPPGLGNLSSLLDIFLDGNQLTGRVPSTIGNLKQLQRLYLYDNKLEGLIPTDICKMIHLGELDLSGNMLEGQIPECFGQVKTLKIVYLDSNKLNSTLPSNFWNLVDIVGLSVSSNYLSGQVSSQIANLKAINYLDLSSNQFSDEIPSAIEACQSLETMNMSNNEFKGSIPQSLGKVRGLRVLDLSSNILSGVIPMSLEDLPFLENFNVSYNRLEGEIPNEGCFRNFTAQSFINNSDLCGAARFEMQPCTKNHARSRSKTSFGSVVKYIVPPFISTIVMVIIVVMLIRKRRNAKMSPSSVDTSLGIAWRTISYNEIERGTTCFSETNLLGRGSFGSVFKGSLSDGLDIAVKVFNLDLEGADRSFGVESRILSSIRHRNLVQIIGCCTNMEFKALILEFMPNGSLEKWLYSDNYCLDLVQRLNIAIDVALAVEHLHHHHTFTVVHCDIKPSNVLLDEDMSARVADFGIAKLFDEGEAMVQTRTLATIGYAAPEYGSEGKVSTSADVYSYGIMLLEMFTGKKPTDDMFNGEMSLKEWVSEALQVDAVDQILAPSLVSNEEGDFVAKEECVLSVLELAMKCSAISPNERIDMIQVAAALRKIKGKVVRKSTRRRQQHAISIT